MTTATAIAMVNAYITAVPLGGMTNGNPYANTSTPSMSHVKAHLLWPLDENGVLRSFVHQYCMYTSANLDTAARAAVPNKSDAETATIVATGRCAATRYYGWTAAHLNTPEVIEVPTATVDLTVHKDHEAEAIAAWARFAASGARYMGLFFYNAISYETSNHNHLPSATKRLATTTIQLTGLKDWIVGDQARESAVFHDMFHPLTASVKSIAARNINAKAHLTGLKFDNLRKRIPVKAPDSGVAINYSTLMRKAKAYMHVPEDLPDTLAAPPNLATVILAYERAADPAALAASVDKLRLFSELLEEPSAYLAGYILGREAHATEDADLDLRTARRTCTILGSPAYARAAGEYSGTFAHGKAKGFRNVPANTADQVLPRCELSIAAAAAVVP